MAETRKLAAILAADVVGYSRLAATDEERTVARLRGLRTDLIDPAISVHHGRVVKRTGDGILIEFRSVVDAVRCAIEVQNGMSERNAGLTPDRQILFRVGIHLGDVIEEADGDLMGDGVNIAARLESICEPGAICLSEHAYLQVRTRLDMAVSDLGSKELKNIPEPVHVFSLEVGRPAQAKPPPIAGGAKPGTKKRTMLIPVAAGVAAFIIIAAIAAWYLLVRPSAIIAANAPAHLSIVVLPFENLSGDPKQDYFADGITDNLTTDLSRIRNSFVIARNTAFTYKGKAVAAKEIGKDLGVRYVLEGSVAREGNRVRVNAQLIDAESGAHLWADRFEEDLSDLFKLQDQVVARLANALGYELEKAEAEKSARTTNPDAIDLTMQARSKLHDIGAKGDKDALEATRTIFENALKLDGNNLDAVVGIADVDAIEFSTVVGAVPGRDRDAASYIARALEIDPQNAYAHYVRAYLLFYLKKLDESAAEARKAVELDANFPLGYVQLAATQTSLGNNDDAITNIERAMVLSPRDPDLGFYHFVKAKALLFGRRTGPSVAEFREAERDGFHIFIAPLLIASALALDNEAAAAEAEVARARKLDPAITISWLKSRVVYPEFIYDGLRKVGLPEDEKPRLSIVVLPFQNLSGDARQDYLADVLTDELTTYISRIPGSFVIARNTAFTYKGKPTDVKTIGKDLGVHYVLEGSVQPTTTRIRTNAQLIDTESGAHLWAEQFDTDKTDLLQTEDEIVTRVARSLDIALVQVEAAKGARLRPDNPDAQDLAMRCLANFNANVFVYDPKRLESLDEPCERALKLDPKNVTALRLLANRHAQMVYRGVSANPEQDRHWAEELIQAASAVDPNDAGVHSSKIAVLYAEGRMEEAINEARRAIELNPSNMYAYYALCASEDAAGQPAAAIECADRAMRLSPHDPLLYLLFDYHGMASSLLEKYGDAIAWYRKALALEPNDIQTLMALARLFAHQGQIGEAHEMYIQAVSVPGMKLKTVQQYRALLARLYPSNAPAMVAYRKSVEEDMRKAGMPEE